MYYWKKSENSQLLLPGDCVLCYTLQIFVHGLHFHKENSEGKYDGTRCLIGDGLKSWQRALGGCASWQPRHLLCSQSWIHAQCSASMLDTSQQWWFYNPAWELRSVLLFIPSWFCILTWNLNLWDHRDFEENQICCNKFLFAPTCKSVLCDFQLKILSVPPSDLML